MNKEKSLAGSNVLEDMSYFTKSSNAPKDSYDLNVSNFPNYIPYNVDNQIISGDNSYNFNSSINASMDLEIFIMMLIIKTFPMILLKFIPQIFKLIFLMLLMIQMN